MDQYDAISFAMEAVENNLENGANDRYCADANEALAILNKLKTSILKRNARSAKQRLISKEALKIIKERMHENYEVSNK